MALNTSRIKLGPANQMYVGGLFYYRERTPPFYIQDNIRVEFVLLPLGRVSHPPATVERESIWSVSGRMVRENPTKLQIQ